MSYNLTPEERARILIDEQLIQAGWVVQDRNAIDLVNHVGVAVRETILKNISGRADYLLYINRKIVGVIEAKPSGVTLTEVQWQSHRYSRGLDADQSKVAVLHRNELPFIYEASGTETHFTNLYDP
jgi:type I restriction enzyme, R subunit